MATSERGLAQFGDKSEILEGLGELQVMNEEVDRAREVFLFSEFSLVGRLEVLPLFFSSSRYSCAQLPSNPKEAQSNI